MVVYDVNHSDTHWYNLLHTLRLKSHEKQQVPTDARGALRWFSSGGSCWQTYDSGRGRRRQCRSSGAERITERWREMSREATWEVSVGLCQRCTHAHCADSAFLHQQSGTWNDFYVRSTCDDPLTLAGRSKRNRLADLRWLIHIMMSQKKITC